MESENPATVSRGCWAAQEVIDPLLLHINTVTITADWQLPPTVVTDTLEQGMGNEPSRDEVEFWTSEMQKNYAGDDGIKRIRMCAINLRDRDGLLHRLRDIKCPVLWMHVSQFCSSIKHNVPLINTIMIVGHRGYHIFS
jgi:hypothetical protein